MGEYILLGKKVAKVGTKFNFRSRNQAGRLESELDMAWNLPASLRHNMCFCWYWFVDLSNQIKVHSTKEGNSFCFGNSFYNKQWNYVENIAKIMEMIAQQ